MQNYKVSGQIRILILQFLPVIISVFWKFLFHAGQPTTPKRWVSMYPKGPQPQYRNVPGLLLSGILLKRVKWRFLQIVRPNDKQNSHKKFRENCYKENLYIVISL